MRYIACKFIKVSTYNPGKHSSNLFFKDVWLTREDRMTELFDDDAEDKTLIAEDEIVEEIEDVVEEVIAQDARQRTTPDARRRLEKLLEDKRLQNELEDFLDY